MPHVSSAVLFGTCINSFWPLPCFGKHVKPEVKSGREDLTELAKPFFLSSFILTSIGTTLRTEGRRLGGGRRRTQFNRPTLKDIVRSC